MPMRSCASFPGPTETQIPQSTCQLPNSAREELRLELAQLNCIFDARDFDAAHGIATDIVPTSTQDAACHLNVLLA